MHHPPLKFQKCNLHFWPPGRGFHALEGGDPFQTYITNCRKKKMSGTMEPWQGLCKLCMCFWCSPFCLHELCFRGGVSIAVFFHVLNQRINHNIKLWFKSEPNMTSAHFLFNVVDNHICCRSIIPEASWKYYCFHSYRKYLDHGSWQCTHDCHMSNVVFREI